MSDHFNFAPNWRRQLSKFVVFLSLISGISIIESNNAHAVSCTNASNAISGGTTSVTSVSTGCLISFTAGTATFNMPIDLNLQTGFQYLVVGGGGGGGRGYCSYVWGGGGGGGAVASGTYSTALTSSTSFLVTVGTGGTGSQVACPNGTAAADGGTSSIGSVITANGGKGAPNSTSNAKGGASGNGNAAGSPTFDSSGNCTSYACNAGGGGGAGAVGSGMNGGTGTPSSITGSSVSYGGGGAGRNNTVYGTADTNAGNATHCTAVANSGAGGADCANLGGNGGSGVVYIYYVPATGNTVTYALGSGSGTLPTQGAVIPGWTFTVASSSGITRTNYYFAGWSDGTTTYAPNSTYTMGASNVTLTALWVTLTQTSNGFGFYYSTINTGSTYSISSTADFTYGGSTIKTAILGATQGYSTTPVTLGAVQFGLSGGTTATVTIAKGGVNLLIVTASSLPASTTACSSSTTTSGGYTIVSFVSATATADCIATWTVPSGLSSAEVVVVGGGGGGGYFGNAGSGAGGAVLNNTNYSLTPNSSISIKVGGGGSASMGTSYGPGINGSNSSFNGIVASGGGGGAGGDGSHNYFFSTGLNGGSGGGGTTEGLPSAGGSSNAAAVCNCTSSGWSAYGYAGAASGVAGGAGDTSSTSGTAKTLANFAALSTSNAFGAGGSVTSTSSTGGGGSAGNAGKAGIVAIRYQGTGPSISTASITGTPIKQGTQLTATATGSSGATSTTYQWSSATTSGGTYSNISGATGVNYTPIASDVGNYLKVTITVTNSYGSASATSSASTVVLPLAPAFTLSSNFETRSVNAVATGFTVNSTGGPITSFSISPSVSAGMSFNTSTGAFSGTPTAALSATTYTITGTNATGTSTAAFAFTVTLNAQATLNISSNLNSAIWTGTAYTAVPTFSTTGGSGTGAVTYSVTNGTATSCTLSSSASNSTLTASSTGPGTCLIKATKAADSAYSSQSSSNLTFTFNNADQASLNISASSTSAVYNGSAYTAVPTFSTTGGSGTGAVTYAIAAGGTAGGCSLSSSASNATLTATSTGTCLIYANKAASTNYNSAVSTNLTFTFSRPLAITTPTNGLVATKDVAFSLNMVPLVVGGVAPYAYTGTYPSWLTLSSAGMFTGTPTVAGRTTAMTVTVTDSKNTSVTTGSFYISITPCGVSTDMTYTLYAPNGYCVIGFTSTGSGTWTPPTGVTNAHAVIIGGGGSGGNRAGGGGGAGGMVETTAPITLGSTATITVGTGGTAVSSSGNIGNAGGNSSVVTSGTTVTANGGGYGASGNGGTYNGGSGGSGGGPDGAGSAGSATQGSGTGYSGFGFNSGTASGSGLAAPYWTGGGGGGAGGIGGTGTGSATASVGGDGGAGRANSITGIATCYAAGGGGGTNSTASRAGYGGSCGGTAIGGAGSMGANVAGSGAANTGSGGGGSGFNDSVVNPNGTSGAGGSGIVFAKYIGPALVTTNIDSSTVNSGSQITLIETATATSFTRTITWQYSTDSGATWSNESAVAVSGGANQASYQFVLRCGMHSSNVCAGNTVQISYRALITDTDSSLLTYSYSPTITITIRALATTKLIISSAPSGSNYILSTTGGGGVGAKSFSIISGGSATGCAISVSTLSATTSGSCKVQANQVADTDFLASSSDVITFFFNFSLTLEQKSVNTWVAPIGNHGIGGVVNTPGIQNNSSATQASTLSVTSLSSTSGAAGSTITITGTGFLDGSGNPTISGISYNLDNVSYTIINSTTITITIPSNETSGTSDSFAVLPSSGATIFTQTFNIP